jgi:CheY-like chemotaxis protein
MGVRVLLVDDDPGAAETIVPILRWAGFEMEAAATGSEAITAAARFRPHVALIDLQLPDLSGLDVLRALRAQPGAPVCLIITGFGTCPSAVEAVRLGAFEYLQKPLFEEDLIQAVQGALASLPASAVDAGAVIESHALKRWAEVLVRFASSHEDASTLREFGRAVGASAGAFRNWCRTARQSPRRSLLFVRGLRAVICQGVTATGPENLLRIVDRRTLTKFLIASGGGSEQLPATVDEYLERQQFVRSEPAITAVREAVRRMNADAGTPERTRVTGRRNPVAAAASRDDDFHRPPATAD